MSAARSVLALASVVCTLAVPGLAASQTGGPDSSGYIYGPAVYDFQAQATNGSATMLAMGDDTVQGVTLPWAFPWYGNTYTTAVVDSNGKIMFNAGASSSYVNACLGLTGTNLPDIAPLWDDLSPNAGGGVYAFYDSALDRQIISWEDVPHFAGTDGVSFQVHLYVSGVVEVHWADTDFGNPAENNGLSATVGIQDAVGATQGAGNALEFSCNTASIVDGTASGFFQCVDSDTDGWPDVACGGSDCDDTISAINPGALEVCGDGIDNDCSGSDGDVDVDGDGGIATSCAGDDCDDTDATIYVGAPELCDQLDNDCDTVVPANESSDADNDGAVTCDDCNDNDATINPSAAEACDGIDTNCDGLYYIGAPPDVAPTATTSGTSSNLFRGNRYLVSSSAVVDHIGYELDAPVGTTITYGIYEGSSLTGPWNSVATSTLTTTQTGNVVHESPSMGVALNIGSYYAMIAHWDQSAGYGWTAGTGLVPVSMSFGTLEGGATGSGIGGTISTSTNVYPMTVFTGQADTDDDGDNLFPCQGDCDDTNATAFPGAVELCDGVDTDCAAGIPGNE
ncbi:MAG: hypothetical protein GY901_13885, partial [Actinomycetia bacterium]|nr:hypothetical protein [Actinomycetes bacterium]